MRGQASNHDINEPYEIPGSVDLDTAPAANTAKFTNNRRPAPQAWSIIAVDQEGTAADPLSMMIRRGSSRAAIRKIRLCQ